MPTLRRVLIVVLSVFLASALHPAPGLNPAFAQSAKKNAKIIRSEKGESAKSAKKAAVPTTGPADYSSQHFVMHTDLPAEEAQALLKRLETMLGLISKYWGRPPSGIIEMYVVQDLGKWPAGSLDPDGLASIKAKAGVTKSRVMSASNGAFLAKATVYAVADHGTPQHEAVHAYCAQAFGRTGPVWYAEGMAEMGQYWRAGDPSVNAHPGVIEYLRKTEPKSLNEIVNGEERTGDSWQNYAWRWALCHLLANNTNYAQRFRPLGLALLTKRPGSFEDVYGSMAKEITFEYLLFLKHVEPGFRVDLCSWDWKAKFGPLRSTTIKTSKIKAGRGWQPSLATLEKGAEYEYSVSGTWTLSKSGTPVAADGDESGNGKLEGILFDDYKLLDVIPLGKYGTFTAPASGDLYLRCADHWCELADNKGEVSVKLKLKGQGASLPPPETKPESKSAATKRPPTN